MTQPANILEKSVSLNDDLVARNNDDGTIVVMRMDESNIFFKIDGVAAKVWTGLKGKQNLKEIFVGLKSEYDVSDETLMTDIEKFISDLQSRNLITIS